MSSPTSTGQATYSAIGRGTLRLLLQVLPRPAWAWGGSALYFVSLEGADFVLALEGTAKPMLGFFTHRIVAARSPEQADQRARDFVLRDWRSRGYALRAQREPTLVVTEVARLVDRFRLRSRIGFVFHSGE